MKNKNMLAGLLAVSTWLPFSALAEQGDSLDVLIDEGKVTLDFRYRYENVDQEGFAKDANAHTLRTRLGFQSGAWRGWDFNIEVNDVRHLNNDFNAGGGTTSGRTEYPTVADPKGTRLNQGYVSYTGIEDLGFKVGRQRINLDNQRFVGSVGWRQTEQVFDAGNVVWGDDDLYVGATYVQWARRIFGESSSSGKSRQDGTVFVNGGWKTPIGKLAGYFYHIDDEDFTSFSSDTIGVRLAGTWKVNEDWSLRYEGEYAHQSDAGSNPVDFSADYFHLNGAAVVGIFDFGLGWELLGGDADTPANEAFRTPFATLHKFNGWADQFLTTPSAGLSDLYLMFKANPGKFLIQARYHEFEADDGNNRFGNELDLQAGYSFARRFRADLFLAEFNGRNQFGDVTKIWVQLLFTL